MTPPRRPDQTDSDRRHADDDRAHDDAERRDAADGKALRKATCVSPCATLNWRTKVGCIALALLGTGYSYLLIQSGRALERDADRREAIAGLKATVEAAETKRDELLEGQRRILAALRSTAPIAPYAP